MRQMDHREPCLIDLPYRVVLPDVLNEGTRYPLIVLLHGFSKSAEIYSRLCSRINETDYIYLVGQGSHRVKLADRVGFGWLIGSLGNHDAESRDRSEAYLLRMMEQTSKNYPVDTRNVFMVGFSQGAFLAYHIGFKNPERIGGIAAVGGWMNFEVTGPHAIKNAGRLRVGIFHGIRDEDVTLDRAEGVRDWLADHGTKTSFHLFDAGHRFTSEMCRSINDWIRKERPLPDERYEGS